MYNIMHTNIYISTSTCILLAAKMMICFLFPSVVITLAYALGSQQWLMNRAIPVQQYECVHKRSVSTSCISILYINININTYLHGASHLRSHLCRTGIDS